MSLRLALSRHLTRRHIGAQPVGSAILVICASLREFVFFFLLTKAHVYLCSLQVLARCESHGLLENWKALPAHVLQW